MSPDMLLLIKDVFELHYLENRGAAFGMLQNQRAFFIIITVGILIILYSVAKSGFSSNDMVVFFNVDFFLSCC